MVGISYYINKTLPLSECTHYHISPTNNILIKRQFAEIEKIGYIIHALNDKIYFLIVLINMRRIYFHSKSPGPFYWASRQIL